MARSAIPSKVSRAAGATTRSCPAPLRPRRAANSARSRRPGSHNAETPGTRLRRTREGPGRRARARPRPGILRHAPVARHRRRRHSDRAARTRRRARPARCRGDAAAFSGQNARQRADRAERRADAAYSSTRVRSRNRNEVRRTAARRKRFAPNTGNDSRYITLVSQPAENAVAFTDGNSARCTSTSSSQRRALRVAAHLFQSAPRRRAESARTRTRGTRLVEHHSQFRSPTARTRNTSAVLRWGTVAVVAEGITTNTDQCGGRHRRPGNANPSLRRPGRARVGAFRREGARGVARPRGGGCRGLSPLREPASRPSHGCGGTLWSESSYSLVLAGAPAAIAQRHPERARFEILGDVVDVETIASGSGIRDLARLRAVVWEESLAEK